MFTATTALLEQSWLLPQAARAPSQGLADCLGLQLVPADNIRVKPFLEQ